MRALRASRSSCATAATPADCPTTTTDANGNYIFEGLAAGTYTVKITDLGADGLPATGDEVLTGYTQTFDPNGPVCRRPARAAMANPP